MTTPWTNVLYCVVNPVLGHIVISWVAAMSTFHLVEREKGAWGKRHA